VGVQYKFF